MRTSSSFALVFLAAASCIGAMAGGVVAQVGTGASSGAPSGGTDAVVAGPGDSDPAQSHGNSQMGMAQIPAGIGERGTGQTQSTLERSGMEQSRSPRGMASDTPAGIGEKGTGQTQSTQERSVGDQNRNAQGTASLPPAE
jgi:hypothetical protein